VKSNGGETSLIFSRLGVMGPGGGTGLFGRASSGGSHNLVGLQLEPFLVVADRVCIGVPSGHVRCQTKVKQSGLGWRVMSLLTSPATCGSRQFGHTEHRWAESMRVSREGMRTMLQRS